MNLEGHSLPSLALQRTQQLFTFRPPRMAPGEQVLPGQEKTFTFNATAPLKQGVRQFWWRMRLEVSPQTYILFGQPTQVAEILVAGPCYCPPGGQCPDVLCLEPE